MFLLSQVSTCTEQFTLTTGFFSSHQSDSSAEVVSVFTWRQLFVFTVPHTNKVVFTGHQLFAGSEEKTAEGGFLKKSNQIDQISFVSQSFKKIFCLQWDSCRSMPSLKIKCLLIKMFIVWHQAGSLAVEKKDELRTASRTTGTALVGKKKSTNWKSRIVISLLKQKKLINLKYPVMIVFISFFIDLCLSIT